MEKTKKDEDLRLDKLKLDAWIEMQEGYEPEEDW